MTQGVQTESEADAQTIRELLFRYAKDMEELMQQQKVLEQQHRMLLQSLGRETHSDDMLASLLVHAAHLVWVTDAQGVLIRVSGGRHGEREARQDRVVGRNILDMVSALQRSSLETMLARFVELGARAVGIQCRIDLPDAHTTGANASFDALILQVRQGGRFEIYWLMRRVESTGRSALAVQSDFVNAVHSDSGLLLTDPFGTICAVNDGYCAITGYAQDELVHNNPRLVSSGRHDAEFYHALWLQLLDQGSWSGTIFNRRKGGQIFLEWQSIKMIENLEGQVVAYLSAAADLSHVDPASKHLEVLANSDPLTGLPNRRLLTDRLTTGLADARQRGLALALLYMDLNAFKPINDSLGHEVGDQVLKAVAQRLQQALLPSDLLARVGGDEFVVLLSGTRRVEQVEFIADHIRLALSAPIQIGRHQLSVSVSIGCARYPLDGEDVVTLLEHADAAMYAAKRFALSFSYYDVGLVDYASQNLVFDLWQALDRNEIRLVYQPQLRSQGKPALRGCEALMRWTHPRLGDIEPTVFIAIAEKSGAIISMGYWALQNACAQLQDWRNRGMPELMLSLNLSLRQLRDAQFVNEVAQALVKYGVPAHLLELELSESQALLLAPGDIQTLLALRELGVRIAIDDFGISLTSLSRLRALSISSFKIYSQCVQTLQSSADARAISSSLLAIGQALDIEVIAQGVETQEQLEILTQQGCQVVQGFYAGHPVSADTLFQMAKVV